MIKYVTRWREKGGIADLEKAIHFLQMLIELEARDPRTLPPPDLSLTAGVVGVAFNR